MKDRIGAHPDAQWFGRSSRDPVHVDGRAAIDHIHRPSQSSRHGALASGSHEDFANQAVCRSNDA